MGPGSAEAAPRALGPIIPLALTVAGSCLRAAVAAELRFQISDIAGALPDAAHMLPLALLVALEVVDAAVAAGTLVLLGARLTDPLGDTFSPISPGTFISALTLLDAAIVASLGVCLSGSAGEGIVRLTVAVVVYPVAHLGRRQRALLETHWNLVAGCKAGTGNGSDRRTVTPFAVLAHLHSRPAIRFARFFKEIGDIVAVVVEAVASLVDGRCRYRVAFERIARRVAHEDAIGDALADAALAGAAQRRERLVDLAVTIVVGAVAGLATRCRGLGVALGGRTVS